MKYSITGRLSLSKSQSITDLISQHTSHFMTHQVNDSDVSRFAFEALVDTESEKDDLFDALKPMVESDELIQWHECTHDEEHPKPCRIAETYRGS